MTGEPKSPNPSPSWKPAAYYRVALGCLALLFLAGWSQEVGLVLKLFVDLLTLGISMVKTWLFLAFSALVFFLLGRSRSESSHPPQKNPQISDFRALGCALILLHALAVGQQLQFNHSLGLASTQMVLSYVDYDYAKTHLVHIHVTKAVLGQWFQGANFRFDGGAAFLPYLSRPSLLFHFVLLAGTCLWALRSIRFSLQSLASPKQAPLVLSIFILLETSIDGGPLSSQALAAAVVYLRLTTPLRLRMLLLLVGLPIVLLHQLTGTLFVEHLVRFLATLGTLMLSGAVFHGQISQFARAASVLGIVSATVVVPWGLSQASPRLNFVGTAYTAIRYGLTPLYKNQVVHIVSLAPLPEQAHLEKLHSEQTGPYVLTRLRLKKPTTILDLCRQFGLNISRRPIHHGTLQVQKLRGTRRRPSSIHEQFERFEVSVPTGSTINYAAAQLGQERWLFGSLTLQSP